MILANRWRSALLVGLLACAGCAGQGADVEAIAGPALASAASQVKRCYRSPRVSHAGRQIVTTLRVRMTPEGFPDGLPAIIAQRGVTPDNSAFAARMGEAAIVAVLRCAPLRLPAELY
ncbi:MAG: hypothetical protein ACXW2T_09605, partial [Allosphingosinicella sp.]